MPDPFFHAMTVKKIEATARALRENNMEAFLIPDQQTLREQIEGLLPRGASVAAGGSASLTESGVYALLRALDQKGEITFHDRGRPGLDAGQKEEMSRKAFSCDYYFLSANAITENGELFNVDGIGNRVAALSFGPRHAVVIAGYNKIVRDIPAAIHRVKAYAAPANCKRLSQKTPCAENGSCVTSSPFQGCTSEDRICRSFLVTSRQREKGRIRVFLLPEILGY